MIDKGQSDGTVETTLRGDRKRRGHGDDTRERSKTVGEARVICGRREFHFFPSTYLSGASIMGRRARSRRIDSIHHHRQKE